MPAKSTRTLKRRSIKKRTLVPLSERPKKKYPFPTPIPPCTVVRVKASATKKWKATIGKHFPVGYYSRKDGLDCIWLVNGVGEYQETIDHEFLYRFFEIELLSKERSRYGENRPRLGPIAKSAS